MHITQPHVVSEVTGESGMAILRAMRAGARDPEQWARLRHDRGHHAEETSAQALHGQWREEPRLAWAQAVALDDLEHQKSAAGDRPIDAPRGTLAEGPEWEAWPPGGRPRKRTRHRPHVDGRGSLHRLTGVDWTAMEGLDEPTALTSISAMGWGRGAVADREAFHLLAWALSAPPGLWGPGVIARHEAVCQPGGARAAAGRVVLATPSECLGGLLPTHASPPGDAEGDHRHRAYTCPLDRRDAQARHGLCPSEYGGLCTTLP